MIARSPFPVGAWPLRLLLLASLLGCNPLEGNGRGPDPADALERLWYTPFPNVGGLRAWHGLPAIVGDTAVVGVLDGLAALDVRTGRTIWRAKLWEEFVPSARSLVAGDGLTCVADIPSLSCHSLGTGAVLWAVQRDSSYLNTEPALSGGWWFVGTGDHRVLAFEAATGRLRWTTDVTPETAFASTVFGVAVSGDTVYAATVRLLTAQGGSTAGDLVALDRATGRMLFTYTSSPQYDQANTRGGFQGAPLIHGRLAIVNDTYWHALIAVDRFTGQEVWRTATGGDGYVNSETPPIVVGDTLFAASSDTQLYAIDLRTGRQLWRTVVVQGSLGSVAACGSVLLTTQFAGGVLFATDRGGRRSAQVRIPGDRVYSRIGVAGDIAVFSGFDGVYGYRCR